MNIQFETKSYQTGAEMIEEARARRKRFEMAARRALVKSAPVPVIEAAFITKRVPQWELFEMNFDAHVVEWNYRRSHPAHAYLKDRCIELGMPYRKVIGARVLHEIVAVRHLLMWEIYDKFPLSLPQIGRMFGGRDHTTVLYAIRKIEARMKIEEEALAGMVTEAIR